MQGLDRHDLKRRAFLIAGGQATAAALAGSTYGLRPVFAENRPAWSAQEQRIAETVETYDAQGNHRTATSADTESAVWLATRIRFHVMFASPTGVSTEFRRSMPTLPAQMVFAGRWANSAVTPT